MKRLLNTALLSALEKTSIPAVSATVATKNLTDFFTSYPPLVFNIPSVSPQNESFRLDFRYIVSSFSSYTPCKHYENVIAYQKSTSIFFVQKIPRVHFNISFAYLYDKNKSHIHA